MNFEIKRKIDTVGRIVIPSDLRKYYGISSGDTLVFLSVRDGVQIAKSYLFISENLTSNMIATIDTLGRIVIPCAFRTKHGFCPQRNLYITPNETCILVRKEATSQYAEC